MKLNVKKTIAFGTAFMTINLLWQVYNWKIPQILESHLSALTADEIIIGIIMALDNLFAIFMIPLTGRWSDKVNTRLGKRMPFILIGMVLSAISFIAIPFTTKVNFWLLLANIVLVLLTMNIYRAPCVALMPDVTPSPLRNKANSLINIMGGVGTAIGMIAIMLTGKKSEVLPYAIVAIIMIGIVVFLYLKVNEPKMVAECKEECKREGIEYTAKEEETSTRAKTSKRNVLITLATVFLIYMGSNAVDTFLSLYGKNIFAGQSISFLPNLEIGTLMMIPYGIGMFGCAVPAALLADKIGRRKTVCIGCALMALGYILVSLLGQMSALLLLAYLPVGVGFSFAIINVYPMTVESCETKDIGKYTGFYYIASMSAQTVTPALCGLFLSRILPFGGFANLFPYAAVFLIIAAIVVSFAKENK